MNKKVLKAIIPAAGFGTRMLPFTKSVPKELIPLVDAPVLQYIVEEAVDAGIEKILIIISRGKEAVIRHFENADELEKRLADSGKTELLSAVKKTNSPAEISYVYQDELNGLGGAVMLGRDFAGDDPCLVMLGDTVMDSSCRRSVSGQLIDVYDRYGTSVVALAKVPPEKVSSYGIAAGEEIEQGVLKLTELVEKPSPENAPGDNAVAARYLFTPGIFSALQKTAAGLHNEIQLTDAVRMLMGRETVMGCRFSGKRFDLGNVADFVAANVEFALRRPELQEILGRRIVNILKEKHITEQ